MSSKVLNTKEAAVYLRMGIRTIYRLVISGQIPAVKVGKSWRFHIDALDKWLISLSEENLVRNNPNRGKHHTSSKGLAQEIKKGEKVLKP